MSSTFSININTLIESTKKADIFSVLSDIQDNTQKLISPKDVRDAFFTIWADSPFKVTSPNLLGDTYEYIGIDSSNPNNRDIKKKILLGKRSFGGSDILTTTLLNSINNADIFLYNTKSDNESQDSTKISILAGTNSGLYFLAPYIESIVGSSGSINLNIVNPAINGAINIISNTGRVSLNTILFPTVAETVLNATNGRILRYHGTYPNGYLKWADPTITYTDIGISTSETNIYGSDVYLNGYSLEFIDDNLVTNPIGNIEYGMSFSEDSFWNGATFQNWPLSEILREVLFPYTTPLIELSIINNTTNSIYCEVGKTASLTLTYSITTFQRNSSESIVDWEIIPNTGLINQVFSGKPGSILSGTVSSFIFSSVLGQRHWNLNVSDNIPNFFSHSTTASIEYVYPIFYGYSNTIIEDSTTLKSVTNQLSKYIYPYPGLSQSINLNYSGSGYLYLIYSNSFGELKKINDPNGFILHDSIIYNGLTMSNQLGFNNIVAPFTQSYNSSSFKVWRSSHISSYTHSNNKFKFTF